MSALATDDFAGTGALSANWTANDNNSTTMSRSSGQAISDDATSDAAYRYSGISWPNDQYSQVILGPATAGLGSGYGACVRMDTAGTLSDATHDTYYRLVGSAGGYERIKLVGAAGTSLESSSGTTFTSGDTLYHGIVGTQATFKKNGVTFGSPASDSAIASGAAGIGHSSTSNVGDGIASWEGGDFASALLGIGAARIANKFVGPAVQRFLFRQPPRLDTTVAAPTNTATGPLPIIVPNPNVGPPALRQRARWQTFWSNAPSSVLNNYVLSADSGVYTLTGTAATILRAALLKANSGTYTITGQTASTLAGRLIKANSGVYNLTGQTATLLTTRLLNAGPGTYNLTGQTAKITATRVLSATAGVYNVTGNSASLLKGYLIKANPGSYTVTGASASTLTTRLLSAAAGIYTISGKAATLLYTPVGPTTSNLLLDTTNGHIIKQVTTHVYIDLNNGHLIWKVL